MNSKPFVPKESIIVYQLGVQLNRKALLKNLKLSEFNNRRCKNCKMLEPTLTNGWCNACIVAEFNSED